MLTSSTRISGSAIAFIDRQVADYQSLTTGVTPGTEVVILDEKRDAIEQITEVLAIRTNIDSIHIVSHGSPGSLQLGNGRFSQDNLETYAEKLRQWRSALNPDADILIYGCNVASGPRICSKVRRGINSPSHSASRLKPTEKKAAIQSSLEDFRYETGVSTPGGSEEYTVDYEYAIDLEGAIEHQQTADNFTFIQRIAQLTNTNVAASKNLTGSAAKGGDWKLETTTGKIAASLAFRPEILATYSHVLSTFSEARNYDVGKNPVGMDTGDLNGDGFLDLAAVNQGSKNISILLGTGTTGSFGTATTLFDPGNENPFGIVVRDFNGDGKLDLAVASNPGGSDPGYVSIRLGTGTGSFGNPTNFASKMHHSSIAAGDFNGDGKLDLATAPKFGNDISIISILFGDGTGSFGNPVPINTNKPKFTVATADFNGDGKLDLVTSNNEKTDNISVFLGDGNDNFNAPVHLSAGNLVGQKEDRVIVTGDFNGDGKLDLAASNQFSKNVSVFLGDGTGNFGTATNFAVPGGPQSLVAGDFNGDGKLDLATSTGSNEVSILLGDGTGKFGNLSNFSKMETLGGAPAGMAAGDFNADGKLDLATTNLISNDVSVLLNTSNRVNFGAVPDSVEGTTDKVVNIPVILNGGTPLNDIVVPILLDPSSTATENSDYIFSPTSITFPAGSTGPALTKNIAVTIKSDSISENPETAIFNLGTITGAIAGPTKTTTLTIADRVSVAYDIATDTATIEEGSSGKKPLTFTVTRSNVTNGASSVKYAIGGTATNGSDYNNIGGTSRARNATGTINFVTGETSKTITLDVLGDTRVEPDETITITLSNPTGIAAATPVITSDTATTTIINYTAPTPEPPTPEPPTPEPPTPPTPPTPEPPTPPTPEPPTPPTPPTPEPPTPPTPPTPEPPTPPTPEPPTPPTPPTPIPPTPPTPPTPTPPAPTPTPPSTDNRPPLVNRSVLSQGGFKANELTFAANTDTDPDPGDKISYTICLADYNALNSSAYTWETDLNGRGYRELIDKSNFPEIPLPSWLTFNPETRTINLDASRPKNFNYWLKVTGTDSSGASVSEIVRFKSSSFKGFVIDNYIAGATIFLDANKNGILDPDEPSAITSPNGEFDLSLASDIFDKNQNGEIDPEEGNLVATGGTDTATGLPLETPVTAPPDASVVTLLTTLVADLIDKGVTPAEAQSLVKTALSIPANIDLTSLDPIAATNNNQPGGIATLSAMVKVQNFITQTAASIDGASSASTNDIVKAVVSSITSRLQSGTVLNLSNAADLEPIIQQSAAKIQQIDPSFNSQKFTQTILQAATVMATANQRIDAAVSSTTGTSIPEAVARVQKVALGETTQDLKAFGAGTKTISQVVTENTGAALDTQIQAVTLPAGIATPVVTGDAELGSNSPDRILGTNGDDILTGGSENDVLMGMRGNDYFDGAIGNDSLFGGKGNDIMLGSSGNDALFGSRGADILNGGDGNDILLGGKGDDLLTGGLGSDTLTGGNGNDKFLLATNAGTDTITDFEVGKDLLVLGNNLTFAQLSITQENSATFIRLSATDEILASLNGVSASSIDAVNFNIA
ncbi:MAG: DUF4347 domain-containing protein [Oscillatoriaceae cyanobacterium Prado104]|jgi:Ca2+-binding RTX toxin-like protein|nr:DUF4347 domain-containing protein [Oscillatoriaceae cyanobacterium Prado104]